MTGLLYYSTYVKLLEPRHGAQSVPGILLQSFVIEGDGEQVPAVLVSQSRFD